MNKVRKRTATSLLASSISLALFLSAATTVSSQPIMADATTTPFVSPILAAANSQPDDAQFIKVRRRRSEEDSLRFTFQHHLDRNGCCVKLPQETVVISPEKIATNPLFFFELFKQKFSQLAMLRKPVQASTVIELLLPERVAEDLGKLPALFMETDIDQYGIIGNSDLVWFPYQHEIKQGRDNTIFYSKGLKGQFTFNSAVESLTTQLSLLGFTATETSGKGGVSLGETTFRGTFYADLMPSQMSLNVPTFKFFIHKRHDNGEVNLQDLVFNVDVAKASNGLKLVEVDVQVGHFDFRDKDSKFSLDNLAVKNDIDEQDDVINNTIQAQIGKLRLPEAITSGEKFELSYAGQIAFRRLDAEALLVLHTMGDQLYQQQNHPTRQMRKIKKKFMEVLPQLLAKSPEIALTETLETSKGNLQGRVSVSIDGEKVTSLTSLENPLALIPALQAQVEISIDKTLLEQTLTMLRNQSPKEVGMIQELIPMFVAQNLLVETDDSYKIAASFENGMLTINGLEIPDPLSFVGGFLGISSSDGDVEMPPADDEVEMSIPGELYPQPSEAPDEIEIGVTEQYALQPLIETPPVEECSSTCQALFEKCSREAAGGTKQCRQFLDEGHPISREAGCVPGCTMPAR